MKDLLIILYCFSILAFVFFLGYNFQKCDEDVFLEQCIENNLDYSLADREQRCNQALNLFLDKKPDSNQHH